MLWTLFAIVVVDLIGFGIVIPVLPFYAESYGASATVLGLLLMSYSAMQFLFAPIWGRLSDRIGRKPIMLLTIAGTSIALLVLGLANSLLALFASRLLAGAFAGNISVATAYVTDVTTAENRTRWMGMIGASFGIGFILGPAIGGLLAPHGYGVPMLVAAGLAAANFVSAIIILQEPPRHKHDRSLDMSRGKILKNQFIRRMCIIYFLFTIGMTQLEAIFAFFMMDRFGYDAREVAYILVMMALIMVGIQGGAIRGLAKRFGERNLLLVGALILCLTFLIVPWMHSVPILLIPLAGASIGRGISQPSMLSLVSHAASPRMRGAVMGTFQSSASLARVIGPAIAGFSYDIFVGSPFFLASFLMIIVIALGQALPSPRDITFEDAELALE